MPSTTAYRQGDIVLVSFPFTDLTSLKRRPAVVVSPNSFNVRNEDVVLVAVTSQAARDAATVLVAQSDVTSAVHHQGLMRLAILGDVLQAEAPRQSEIELHGGELPQPADGVHQLYVDLGSVEGGLVGHHLHRHIEPRGGFRERVFGQLPLLGRAIVLAAGAVVPGGKLGFILIEAVGVKRIDGELQTVDDLVFDLLGSAEDVRIVLRKSADAEQAVQDA